MSCAIIFGCLFRAKIVIISIGPLSTMAICRPSARPHGIQAAPDAVRRQGTNFRTKPRQSHTTVRYAVYG